MTEGHRRIDRIRDPAYLDGLADRDLEEIRVLRDECLAEREYLSLLRRLVQGRAEILKAELDARGSDEDRGPLVDRLAAILAGDEQSGSSRGEALKIGLPEEEMLLARRRIERLVADAGISDPQTLDDDQLVEAVDILAREEQNVSEARARRDLRARHGPGRDQAPVQGGPQPGPAVDPAPAGTLPGWLPFRSSASCAPASRSRCTSATSPSAMRTAGSSPRPAIRSSPCSPGHA